MATDYSSLLRKYGVTSDQVRGMSDSQLSTYAKKEGLSVSSIRSALGSSSPSSSSSPVPAALSSASSPSVQSGFGGMKQWDALQKYAMADVGAIGSLSPEDKARTDKLSGEIDTGLQGYQASLDRMSKANESMLKGEIPADVTASVRRAASENSIMRGIGGQASRALSARDLGLTSADIQQKGMANETEIQKGISGLAQARENIRQYTLTRSATLQELQLKAHETNQSAIDLERTRIATNINANVEILGHIANLVSSQQQLAVQAASAEIDPSGLMSSFDNWIKQFSSKLSN